VAGVGGLRFEGDLARLNGVTAATRRDDDLVREVWGKALFVDDGGGDGRQPGRGVAKERTGLPVLRTCRNNGPLIVSSIAPLFPSEQTRQSNTGLAEILDGGTPQ